MRWLATVPVLLVALVVFALGLRALVTGHHVFGSPGHPVWNLLQIYRRDPVKAHPVVARVLGAFLVLAGGFGLYRVVLEWLSLAAR